MRTKHHDNVMSYNHDENEKQGFSHVFDMHTQKTNKACKEGGGGRELQSNPPPSPFGGSYTPI